ncbi:MAG: adenylate kinase [Oscillospiraceae bacterium]|nr:adenylate kinase [Oscillospiraceae bacterium]
MRRVLVIGCPGSGKSTFARRLRDKTGLPLFYLDMLWHKPDKTNISPEEFDKRLAEMTAGDAWIIDGNYLRTLPPRLERCDTVFFLDFTAQVCLAGARARIGEKREDMPWTETELDDDFMRWILDFPEDQLPRIRELLDRYGESRQIVLFNTREEADAYLQKYRAD